MSTPIEKAPNGYRIYLSHEMRRAGKISTKIGFGGAIVGLVPFFARDLPWETWREYEHLLIPMIIIGGTGVVCLLVGLLLWATNNTSILINTENKTLETPTGPIPFQSIVAINLQDYVHLQPTQYGEVKMPRYMVSAGLAQQDEEAVAFMNKALETLSEQRPDLAKKIQDGIDKHPAQTTGKQQPLATPFSALTARDTAEFIARTLELPMFELCSPYALMERSAAELGLSMRELIQRKQPELEAPKPRPEGITLNESEGLFEARFEKNILTIDNKSLTLQQGRKKKSIPLSSVKTIYAQTLNLNFLLILANEEMLHCRFSSAEQAEWLRDAIVRFLNRLPNEPIESAGLFR
jgi:hypothetical protein